MNARSEISAFKDFILKGNIIDIAIGTIVSTAFSGIVTSAVKDLLTPVLNLIGTRAWSNQYVTLRSGPNAPYKDRQSAADDGAVLLTWGVFVENAVNFVLQSLCLFLTLRVMHHLGKRIGK